MELPSQEGALEGKCLDCLQNVLCRRQSLPYTDPIFRTSGVLTWRRGFMAEESSDRWLFLNRLADEFVRRRRAGERVTIQEYLDRYPELADGIRDIFPALDEVEQIA